MYDSLVVYANVRLLFLKIVNRVGRCRIPVLVKNYNKRKDKSQSEGYNKSPVKSDNFLRVVKDFSVKKD